MGVALIIYADERIAHDEHHALSVISYVDRADTVEHLCDKEPCKLALTCRQSRGEIVAEYFLLRSYINAAAAEDNSGVESVCDSLSVSCRRLGCT